MDYDRFADLFRRKKKVSGTQNGLQCSAIIYNVVSKK